MAHTYNIHQAKTQFSKLVAAVEAGERVIICRNGEPVIECVPVQQSRRAFPFGVWQVDKVDGLRSYDQPTDDTLLDDMGL